ncbi:hypothetical protein EJD97_002812 [Solanum chilense]|uniref:Mediator of RNA polymerase II transcription subunit 31 n=1 Tax=Solanum chilense TaxID=4083 RepID=A0A6N2BV49_SOLCI|nr:hypothetical protein EJD97_002812 [Solanum chilense]
MDSISNPDTHESCMQYLVFPQMNLQKSGYKDPDDGRQRFLLELEIHSMPRYPNLYSLYPHCLFFLELLQNPSYLNAMAHPANKPPASLPSGIDPAAPPPPAPTHVSAAALSR